MTKDEQAFWDACAASAAGSTFEEVSATYGGEPRKRQVVLLARAIAASAFHNLNLVQCHRW